MPALDFFARHPVFTRTEFANHALDGGATSPRTVDAALSYHVRRGHLVRVRRGLYASVPRGYDVATWPVDPYLLASRLADDAVIGYHAALRMRGRAHSVLHSLEVVTTRAVRPFAFQGQTFRAVAPRAALVRAGQVAFGVRVEERAGLPLRVTSLERSLVDVLDRLDLAGGWEEAWRSLEMVEYFDLDELVAYALLLDNATTIAKVGLFLEQNRRALGVAAGVLDRLRARRPVSPHYLERSGSWEHRLIAGWNLVVPEPLATESWREEG